jgi:hypothetical protein
VQPVTAYSRAFADIQDDLKTYIHASAPGKYDAAMAERFARIQAQLADDLRASLTDLEPFARERAVMLTTKAFRDALSTAGLVDEKTSMKLAKDAVSKVGLHVQAQVHDQQFADERKAATDDITQREDVTQWAWKATLDVHTCLFCVSMHGRAFPMGVPMKSHPNCRCIPVPEGTRLADGQTFLANLSRANRERVMGKARARMWEEGDADLSELVDEGKHGVVPLRNFRNRFALPAMRRMSDNQLFNRQAPIGRLVESGAKKRVSIYDLVIAEDEFFDRTQGFDPYPTKWVRTTSQTAIPKGWEVDTSHMTFADTAEKQRVARVVRRDVPWVYRFLARSGLKSNWNGLFEVGEPWPEFGDPPPAGVKHWASGIWFNTQVFAKEKTHLDDPDWQAMMRVRQLHTVVHELLHSFSDHQTTDPDDYQLYSWLEEGPADLLARRWTVMLQSASKSYNYNEAFARDVVNHDTTKGYNLSVQALDAIAEGIEYPWNGDAQSQLGSPGAQLAYDLMNIPLGKRSTWLKHKVELYRRKHHGRFVDHTKKSIDGHLDFLTRERYL